jgi:deoxyribose-phosphate aldolase
LNSLELNKMIDHTLLKPEATPADVRRVCDEAKEFGFFSVCVNTHYVQMVASELKDSVVSVCSIAGFPLGAVDSRVKAYEAKTVVENGADEVDMVLNIGALKSGEERLVEDDIGGVVEVCGKRVVKVIIEAALLSDEEKYGACELAISAGASFVKTSTGFGPPGATVEDVRLMRKAVGPDFGVKASAGIRTASFALELVRAGANRIGTSTGVKIMKEFESMRS